MHSLWRLITLLLLFSLPVPQVKAQTYTDPQIKAAYIYQFMRNIDWPADKLGEVFRIGVVSKDTLVYHELKKLERMMLDAQSVEVFLIQDISSLQHDIYHLIYLSPQDEGVHQLLLSHIRGKPVLLVTDLLQDRENVMINFIVTSRRPRRVSFEINKVRLMEQGLNAKAPLLLIGGNLVDIRNIYDRQEDVIRKQLQDLDDLKGQIAGQEQLLREQERAIAAKAGIIESQREEIESQTAWIAEQQARAGQLQQRIESLRKDLESNRTLFAGQAELIHEQQRRIAYQVEEEETRNKVLKDLGQEIKDRESMLASQKMLLGAQAARIENQRTLLWIGAGIILVFAVLIFIVIRSFYLKSRIAAQLRDKNQAIELQNREIKQQQDEIQQQSQQLYKANLELNRLSLIARYTNNVAAILDPEGHIIWVNDAFYKHYGRFMTEDAKHLRSFLQFKSTQDLQDVLLQVLRENRSYTFETFYESEEPEQIIILQSTLSPVQEQGQIKWLVLIQSDVTRLKNIEKELKELNLGLERRIREELLVSREKDMLIVQQNRRAGMGEMLSNIAHQWRQPLSALGLMIQNLDDALEYGELDQAYLEKMITKSMNLIHYMSGTITDFQNFFKPDKEKIIFDVSMITAKALDFVEASISNKNIRVDIDFQDNVRAFGFPKEFIQVVVNILNNARDAVLEQGLENSLIRITTCCHAGKCVLKVFNQGSGIPEHLGKRIFDPYFSTKAGHKGTGLGLYMSRYIVEKNMGGRIYYQNLQDGVEFVVELRQVNAEEFNSLPI